MPNKIQTKLPEKYLNVLGIWVNLMFNPPDLPGYIEFLHKQIELKEEIWFSDYELIVVNTLLRCKDIKRSNLYQYYLNFDSLITTKSFIEKFIGKNSTVPNHEKIFKPSEALRIQDEEICKWREERYRQFIHLEDALAHFRFKEADDIIARIPDLIDKAKYEAEKADKLIDYFSNTFTDKGEKFQLDHEQAEAIGALGQNILVSARAGSGKTRVLAAKILYLLEQEQLSESELCVLAFNRSVPEEILKRINEDIKLKSEPGKYATVQAGMTFHKLARSLVKDDATILVENKTEFIKRIIEYFKANDPEFRDLAFKFLKEGDFKIGKLSFANEAHYYEYLRNLSYRTIKGEEVKSSGEKIIADFLYEHGVEYVYEKVFYPAKCDSDDSKILRSLKDLGKEMHPDFYLPEYDLVWEHWAIDEQNNSAEAKTEFGKLFNSTWDHYHAQMLTKRWFWGDWRNDKLLTDNFEGKAVRKVKGLIETKASTLINGRASLEKSIQEELMKYGVKLKEPDYEALFGEVWLKANDRFAKLMTQFVDRYQQQYFDDKHSFITNIQNKYQDNERLKIFYQLGITVLNEYEEQLKSYEKSEYLKSLNTFALDFNQLIAKAISEIRDGKADAQIKKFKWILIDEFQDFSKLFFTLVQEIQKRNPAVKLFCVGDSWQGINRFAGAETKYFDDFSAFFEDATIKNITTNYRSGEEIIEKSNGFMKKMGMNGEPAKVFRKGSENQIKIIKIDKVFAEFRPGYDLYEEDLIYYKQLPEFKGSFKYRTVEKAKHLKLLTEIISKGPEKKYLFLVRTNNFLGTEKIWIINALKRILYQKGIYQNHDEALAHISIDTMHSSKGLEKEVVVLLGVEERMIPFFHQDADLFQVFGEDYTTTIIDQVRLFYVAVTRAKERLFIVTRNEHESWFLDNY